MATAENRGEEKKVREREMGSGVSTSPGLDPLETTFTDGKSWAGGNGEACLMIWYQCLGE
jgi:hypothetical protein